MIRQTLFCQNVEIENLPNFNNVKVSRYTVATCISQFLSSISSIQNFFKAIQKLQYYNMALVMVIVCVLYDHCKYTDSALTYQNYFHIHFVSQIQVINLSYIQI